MNIRQGLIATAITVLAMLAVSGWALFQPGPELVPVHWNAGGEPDRHAPRAIALITMPGFAVLISLILAVAGRLDPRRANIERSGPVYMTVWISVLGMFVICHGVIAAVAAGIEVPVARIVYAAVGVLLVAIGNVVGKSRSNFTIGVRTPWTLSSDRAWNKTNRAGGRLLVALGFAGALSAFLAPPGVTLFVFLGGAGAVVAFTLVYSWLVWDGERREKAG